MLRQRIERVTNATNRKERHDAAEMLASACRAAVHDPGLLRSFLNNSDLTATERVAGLGQSFVAHARMEFLLGWMYEGGLSDPDGRAWEQDGENKGDFPNYYQEEMRTNWVTTQGGGKWCTSFVGAMVKRHGFKFNTQIKIPFARSLFWSGSRLELWAETGLSLKNHALTSPDQLAINSSSGGYIAEKAWEELTSAVWKQTVPGDTVRAFFDQRFTPQPGDIVVFSSDGSLRGGSHTVMVEEYQADTHILFTVEGNRKDAVGSRSMDLKDPDVLHQIIFMLRLGDEHFHKSISPSPGATSKELIAPVQAIIEMLVEASAKLGWIHDTDSQARVLTWLEGAQNNDTPSLPLPPTDATPATLPLSVASTVVAARPPDFSGSIQETHQSHLVMVDGLETLILLPTHLPAPGNTLSVNVNFHGALEDSMTNVRFFKDAKRKVKSFSTHETLVYPYETPRLKKNDALLFYLEDLKKWLAKNAQRTPQYNFSAHSAGGRIFGRGCLKNHRVVGLCLEHRSSIRLLDPILWTNFLPNYLRLLEAGLPMGCVWGDVTLNSEFNQQVAMKQLFKWLRGRFPDTMAAHTGRLPTSVHIKGQGILIEKMNKDVPWQRHGSAKKALPYLIERTTLDETPSNGGLV